MKKFAWLIFSLLFFPGLAFTDTQDFLANSAWRNWCTAGITCNACTNCTHANDGQVDWQSEASAGGNTMEYRFDMSIPGSVATKIEVTYDAWYSCCEPDGVRMQIYNYSTGQWTTLVSNIGTSEHATPPTVSLCSSGCNLTANPEDYVKHESGILKQIMVRFDDVTDADAAGYSTINVDYLKVRLTYTVTKNLVAHLKLYKFTDIHNNVDGSVQDGPDMMWCMSIHDGNSMAGNYTKWDSKCNPPDQLCSDCGSSWDCNDYEITRTVPGQTKIYTYMALYDDDWENASDLMGDDWLGPNNAFDYSSSGRGNNNSAPAGWGDLCIDDEGTEGSGAANCFKAYYKLWYTDNNAPPAPAPPTLEDKQAPIANAGYDNDTTISISWNGVNDPDSGVSKYYIWLQESIDQAFTSPSTVVNGVQQGATTPANDSGSPYTYNYTSGKSGWWYRAYIQAENNGVEPWITNPKKSQSGYSAKCLCDCTTPNIVAIHCWHTSSHSSEIFPATANDDQVVSFNWNDPSSPSDDVFYYEYNTNSGNTITGNEANTTNLYVNDFELVESKDYYFHVRPKNNCGTWGTERVFNIWYEIKVYVPDAPTLTALSATSMRVGINEGSNPPAAHHSIKFVYGATTKYVQANKTLGDTAYYQTKANWGTIDVTGLSENTQYTVSVNARNPTTGTTTAYGATASKYTLCNDPTNVTATAASVSSINLRVDSFPNEGAGSSGYHWTCTTNPGGGSSSTSRTWTDDGLDENAQYQWKIYYTNGNNVATNSVYSNYRYTLLNPPTDGEVTVTANSASQITISVTKPPNSTAGSTGWEVDNITNPGEGTDSGPLTGGTYSYSDTDLLENEQYGYKVRYKNGDGVWTAQNPTEKMKYTLLDPPTDSELTIIADSISQLTISVVAPPNPTAGLTGCEFINITNSGGGNGSGELTGTYSYQDDGLQQDSEYGYEVRYKNGEGAWTAYNPTEQKKYTLPAVEHTLILRPNGVGAQTSIPNQYPDTGQHWDKVDEASPDGDSTRVQKWGPNWARDLYQLQDAPAGVAGPINCIIAYFRIRGGYFYLADKYAAGKASIRLTNTYDGVEQGVSGTTYRRKSQQWKKNPDSGAAAGSVTRDFFASSAWRNWCTPGVTCNACTPCTHANDGQVDWQSEASGGGNTMEYRFNMNIAGGQATKIEVTYDAWYSCCEPDGVRMQIYNYSTSQWTTLVSNIGTSEHSTPPTISLCSSGCNGTANPEDYVKHEFGALKQIKVRFDDVTDSDGAGWSTINVDYLKVRLTYNATEPQDWTWAEINALQAGINLKASEAWTGEDYDGNCTQVYVEVKYSHPPDITENLTAETGTSVGEIILKWTAAGDDGMSGVNSGYDIRYRTDGAITDANWATSTPYSQSWSHAGGTLVQETMVGLTPGTEYYIALKTKDECPNWSGLSNCAGPVEACAVLAPGALAFSNITTSNIRANWNNGGNTGTLDYYCEEVIGGTSPGWLTDTFSYDFSGLIPAKSYTFRVKARKSGHESGWRELGSKCTLANMPTAAAFTEVTWYSIRANWGANGNSEEAEYYSECHSNATYTALVKASGWTGHIYWDCDDLNKETEYWFRVKARNGDGVEAEGGWCNLGSKTTRPEPFTWGDAVIQYNTAAPWDDQTKRAFEDSGWSVGRSRWGAPWNDDNPFGYNRGGDYRGIEWYRITDDKTAPDKDDLWDNHAGNGFWACGGRQQAGFWSAEHSGARCWAYRTFDLDNELADAIHTELTSKGLEGGTETGMDTVQNWKLLSAKFLFDAKVWSTDFDEVNRSIAFLNAYIWDGPNRTGSKYKLWGRQGGCTGSDFKGDDFNFSSSGDKTALDCVFVSDPQKHKNYCAEWNDVTPYLDQSETLICTLAGEDKNHNDGNQYLREFLRTKSTTNHDFTTEFKATVRCGPNAPLGWSFVKLWVDDSRIEVKWWCDEDFPLETTNDKLPGTYPCPLTVHLKAFDRSSEIRWIKYGIDDNTCPNNLGEGVDEGDVVIDTPGEHTLYYQAVDWPDKNGDVANPVEHTEPLRSVTYTCIKVYPPQAEAFGTITNNSIEARWSRGDNPDGNDYRCQNVTAGTQFGPATDVFSWNSTGLSPNKSYTFQVRAEKSGIPSGWTNLGSKYTLCNKPSAPSLTAKSATSMNVLINENGNPSNTTFSIKVVAGGTTRYVQANKTLGASPVYQTKADWGTIDVTGLSENTQYALSVNAKNGDGLTTAYGSAASKYTLLNPPTDGELSIAANSSSKLTVSVTAPPNSTAGSTGCEFDNITNPGGGTDSGPLTGTYSYADTDLLENQQYGYKVRYKNGDGVPTAYNTTEKKKYTLLDPPTDAELTITANSTSELGLSVAEPPNSAAGSTGCQFTIYTNPGGGGNGFTGTGVYSYQDSGLNPNSQYGYKVRYKNAEGIWTAYNPTEKKKYTLPKPPNVTCNRPINTEYKGGTWTFANAEGFGAGHLQYYRYVWDKSATHSWTDDEAQWLSDTLPLTCDSSGNWYLHVKSYNGDGETHNTTPTADYGPYCNDITPPANTLDLSIDRNFCAEGELRLTWTAPGDDGHFGTADHYYIKYANSPITDETKWTNAWTWKSNKPVGGGDGYDEVEYLTGLTPGATYYACIKTADNVSNWSGLSNSPGTWGQRDVTPPDAITLSSVETAPDVVGGKVLHIVWTAVGDDGNTGTADHYIVKYFSNLINQSNFDSAWDYGPASTWEPKGAGQTESYDLILPDASTLYYVSIKAVDECGNKGPIGNSLGDYTDDTYENNDNKDNAKPITGSVANLVSANSSDEDWFKIQLAAEDDLQVDLTGTTDVNINLYIWDEAGNIMAAGESGGDDETCKIYKVRPDQTTSAWYYIRVLNTHASNANKYDLQITITPDTVPPAEIPNLKAEADSACGGKVTLKWTSPGDNYMVGKAAGYEVRYASFAIVDDATWAAADKYAVADSWTPAKPLDYANCRRGLRGMYYDGNWGGFMGQRVDRRIDMNWVEHDGDGMTEGVPFYSSSGGDHLFSVRWEGYVYYDNPAQKCTFDVRADDGCKLWVDDNLILDKWHAGDSHWAYTVNPFEKGWHKIKLEFGSRTAGPLGSSIGIIQLRWDPVGGSSYLIIPESNLMPEPIQYMQGLKGEYYNSSNWTGSVQFTRLDRSIDEWWEEGSPDRGRVGTDNYSEIWTGFIKIDTEGGYKFKIHHDDWARLKIDGGSWIIGNTDNGNGTHESGSINLSAGWHTIELRHRDVSGHSGMRFMYKSGPGVSDGQVVPADHLCPPRNESEDLSIPGYEGKVLYFAIKAKDDRDNWGALGKFAAVTMELVPPANITDLVATTSPDTIGAIDLEWTAVGSDWHEGQADHYKICYSRSLDFYDDFNAGDALGWTEVAGSWSVTSGQYHQTDGTLVGYSVIGYSDWDNYILDADVCPEGASNDTGVVFRYQDANNWYYFGIEPRAGTGGYLRMKKKVNGELDDKWGKKSKDIDEGTSYHLKVIANGSNFKCYVNGVLELERTAGELPTGKPGLRTNKCATAYDNVTVADIEWWETASVYSSTRTVSGPDGTKESCTLKGLQEGKLYYIAVKTADENPTWSEVSNIARAYAKRNIYVNITSPADGITLPQGRIKLLATPSSDVSIKEVKFEFSRSDDWPGTIIGTATSSPYAVSWSTAPGSYYVKATATDVDGRTACDTNYYTISEETQWKQTGDERYFYDDFANPFLSRDWQALGLGNWFIDYGDGQRRLKQDWPDTKMGSDTPPAYLHLHNFYNKLSIHTVTVCSKIWVQNWADTAEPARTGVSSRIQPDAIHSYSALLIQQKVQGQGNEEFRLLDGGRSAPYKPEEPPVDQREWWYVKEKTTGSGADNQECGKIWRADKIEPKNWQIICSSANFTGGNPGLNVGSTREVAGEFWFDDFSVSGVGPIVVSGLDAGWKVELYRNGPPVTRIDRSTATAGVASLQCDAVHPPLAGYFKILDSEEKEVIKISSCDIWPGDKYLFQREKVAPGAINSLKAWTGGKTASVLLTWTAPGDDGWEGTADHYWIRYADAVIDTEVKWNAATTWKPPPERAVGGAVGWDEQELITGLVMGATYYFCIRTYDEWNNESGLSNSPSAMAAWDSTPPGKIEDLVAGPGWQSEGAEPGSIRLTWTAPWDDGKYCEGKYYAGHYIIRYTSLTSIVDNIDKGIDEDGKFNSASDWPNSLTPITALQQEHITISGLTINATYWFAIKTEDEETNPGGPNISVISNSPWFKAPEEVTPPGKIADLVARTTTGLNQDASIQLTWTAPADDGYYGTSGTADHYWIKFSSWFEINSDTTWETAKTYKSNRPVEKSPGEEETEIVKNLKSGVTYWFCIKTCDDIPNWSDFSNPASAWAQCNPPAKITDLVASTGGAEWTVNLAWTAPGNNGAIGTARLYRVKISSLGAINSDAQWDSATPLYDLECSSAGVYEQRTLEDHTNLIPGKQYWFCIKTLDYENNYSKISNSPSAVVKNIPPDKIADLAASPGTRSHQVDLTWTATGDDGTVGTCEEYDIRYATYAFTWAESTTTIHQVPAEPAPQTGGTSESLTLTITGLDTGTTCWFRIKARDEVPNWSPVSNEANAWIQINVPPAKVENLKAYISLKQGAVELAWTAPGDDADRGQAAEYDLRYAQVPITELNWASASTTTAPSPSPAGSCESVCVTGLTSGTTYYFALKTRDTDVEPLWSELSNCTSAWAQVAPKDAPAVGLPDATAISSGRSPARGDESGMLYLVYYDSATVTNEVYFTKSSNGSSWSAPANISNSAGDSNYPCIAADIVNGQDWLWVVWYDWAGSTSTIRYALSKDGGASWTEKGTVVGDEYFNRFNPSICVDSNHRANVVYEEDDDIWWVWRSTSGAWSEGENISNADGACACPVIVADPDVGGARLYCAWQQMYNNLYEIFLAEYSGGAWSTPKNITADVAGDNWAPCLVIDPDDNLQLVWENGPGNNDIMYCERDSEGNWGFVVNLSSNVGGSSQPSIGVSEGGDVYVVWEDYTTGNWDVYTRRKVDDNWHCVVNVTENVAEGRSPIFAKQIDPAYGLSVIWTQGGGASYGLKYQSIPGKNAVWAGVKVAMHAWQRKYNIGIDPFADPEGDPDKDKLKNIEEFQWATNPLNPDTDADKLPDGWEVKYADPDKFPKSTAAKGLSALAKDADEDNDFDGLINLEEHKFLTNPLVPDFQENELYQNYPNPFRLYQTGHTTLQYSLEPGVEDFKLEMYNIIGERVREWDGGDFDKDGRRLNEPGLHRILWYGKNDDNQTVASGLYILVMRVPGQKFKKTKKIILIK